MNLAFVGPFAHAGLALAIGLGACLNAGLLYRYLCAHGIFSPQPGWGSFALKLAAAVGVMGAALYLAMGPSGWWLQAGWQMKVPALAGLVLLGVAAYGTVLYAFGFRWQQFSRRGAE
jgi:putative peptidoglycan lipid II flippase